MTMSDSSERKRAANLRKHIETSQPAVAIVVDESGESFICPIGSRRGSGYYTDNVRSTMPERVERFWTEDRGRINLCGHVVQKRVCPRGGYVDDCHASKCIGCKFTFDSFRICHSLPFEGASMSDLVHTYYQHYGNERVERCRIGSSHYDVATQAEELEAAKAELAALLEEVKTFEIVEVHEGETHLMHKGMFIKV